jgi:5-(carboxyamino)imidazole ribonucleotide synthase
LTLDCEVSVVLARDEAGVISSFPVAENSHRRGILDVSLVPARAAAHCAPGPPDSPEDRRSPRLRRHAGRRVLRRARPTDDQRNGATPAQQRPLHPRRLHHQPVRAASPGLCGLPLGEAGAHSAAAMVNLLGDLWYETGPAGQRYREPDWSRLYAFPTLKLHLYGKHHARPGRKMGHFTVLDDDPEQARELAMAARALIGIVDAV